MDIDITETCIHSSQKLESNCIAVQRQSAMCLKLFMRPFYSLISKCDNSNVMKLLVNTVQPSSIKSLP